MQDEGTTLPFSIANVRFSPRGVGTLTIHAGDRIPLVFQLWVPKDASGKLNTAPIQLHYLYGSPVSGGKPIEETGRDGGSDERGCCREFCYGACLPDGCHRAGKLSHDHSRNAGGQRAGVFDDDAARCAGGCRGGRLDSVWTATA